MRYRILCAGLLASVAAGTGAAVAADIAVRPQPPMVAPIAAPAYISDWAGFYIGIHGGGGWGHTSIDPGFFTNDPAIVTPGTTGFAPFGTSPSGGVFGFQFGHNWQWGPVVGGVEVDFSGADINDSNTFIVPILPADVFTSETKIEELASARFRLGYLIFPNWLLYGTAGIAWAHSRLETADLAPTGAFTTETSFANEFGWVAGAGLEYKFAEHWLIRGEWLHYEFGRNNQFDVVPIVTTGVIAGTPLSTPDSVRTTVDVARAALSYKF